ncbi:phosphoric monoester hydrolase [Conidiobolus coronatus NRRL 28638]|uniref:Phosphoric monoester hydrolase n=1 Tax=Conidiobolus coronatus (strain ATCC 28846 / CBS 209.66 / NRRL 28638) TaxID=796925 RepID=A0A137NV52_CONC2|nr:phosphoric monoester hydrolase [Conidiobolus coronatus NRRL 28638]|eukprot:KXN66695.1 phosphoric monoester hydrolase [Conidiobolus coronatus NRRL 28638]
MTKTKQNILIFSDFDGTITLQDTGSVLIDEFFSQAKRKAVDEQVFNKEITQVEAFTAMWNAVTCDWEGCKERLKDVALDPYFKEFYAFIQSKDIPLTVLSSGLIQIINWYIGKHIDNFNSVVAANEGDYSKGYWDVKYYDETPYGHDKALTISKSKANYENPLTLFIGDGITDLMACSQSDVVFARRGRDLEKYCKLNSIEHIAFDDFSTILDWLKNYLNN